MILSAGKEILLVVFWGGNSFSCQHYSANISTKSQRNYLRLPRTFEMAA
jgi:hypothetical protein